MRGGGVVRERGKGSSEEEEGGVVWERSERVRERERERERDKRA